MSRTLVRLLLIVGAAVLVLVSAALVLVQLRWTRTFDVPFPDIAASRDPAVVARGAYLVYGAAACANCHIPREEWPKLNAGGTPPLTGGHVFPLPFGTWFSANLTSDPETGIGRRTDGELARVLRTGTRADGRAAFPLMEYERMADDDLRAVISFLRTQPAVRNPVPDHRLTFFGKALMAFAIEPVQGPLQKERPAAASDDERGRYLANDLSLCASCHTDRSERDGSFVGPRFAGGQRMDVAGDETQVYVTPNLTPDPDTSVIGRWTEADFLARFRMGELIVGTPMPWGAYARMTEEDLRSLYRYLRGLQAVRHDTGPVVQGR
jgi:mono/diheme cytochrome c family protein